MAGELSLDLVRTGETIASRLLEELVADVPGTLGEDDAHDGLLILNTLGNLGALDEGDLEDVGISAGDSLAKEGREVVVPANAEAVVPSAEDGEPGTKLQGGVTVRDLSGTVAARGNVANVVGEVGVHGAGLEGDLQLADSGGRQLLVAADGPFHAVEVVGELGAVVAQPVALFRRQVAAPVGHFQVTLQKSGSDDGLGELVPDTGRVGGLGSDVGVGSVGVGGTLALWIRARRQVRGGVVGNIGAGELDLGLLGRCRVSRGSVGREGIGEVLAIILADGRRTGLQGVEGGVGDAQSDLRRRGERLGEVNNEVLEVPV